MSKLAIVIPAYKSTFFDQALLSIANQTNKDFTLYIGDDCSPDNLYSIVEKYENRIPIVYKRFDENLGGKNLVAQWERCIDMIGDEEWIWLFSDDDKVDPTCVESFYRTLDSYPDFDLFHFNVLHINEYNHVVGDLRDFPEVLTIEEFLIGRLTGQIYSTVVEYIFRKSHFIENTGFQNFDLAWGSDDATWIKLGGERSIRNIDNALVYWRSSRFNISSNYWDKDIYIRKLFAEIEFGDWIYQQAKQNLIQIDSVLVRKLLTLWLFGDIKGRIELLSFKIVRELTSKIYFILYRHDYPKYKIAFLYLHKVYKSFLGKFRKLRHAYF